MQRTTLWEYFSFVGSVVLLTGFSVLFNVCTFLFSFLTRVKVVIVVILSVVITVYSNGTTRPTSCFPFPKPIRSMTFSIDSFKRWYIKLEISTEMCPISRSLLYSPYFSFATASSPVCVFFFVSLQFFFVQPSLNTRCLLKILLNCIL